MIPLGYMLKDVASPAPDWVNAPSVSAVHSLARCASADFGDYIPLWRHNGWWLFNSPTAVAAAAIELGIKPETMSLFYYESWENEFDDEALYWRPIKPEASFQTEVVLPSVSATLSGYDVITFTTGTSPECSPLSCSGRADELSVNALCLFDTFEQAKASVERGDFNDFEPGPYRIIAVYSLRGLTE